MFLKNSIYNIIATAAYIGAQQIIIFRHISSISDKIFSDAILTITFINVFIYITSGSLGRTLMMRNEKYGKNDIIAFDFIFILLLFLVFTIITTCFLGSIFGDNKGYYIFCVLICLMLIRTFYNCVKKLRMCFSIITIQNLLYFLTSLIICVFIDEYIDNIYYYFLIPEIVCSLVYLVDYQALKFDVCFTNNFIEIKDTCLNFSLQTFFSSLISYFDRFLIVPILGAEALALYFSATVLSKCIMMLSGPINDVIASMLANTSSKSRIKVFGYLREKTKKHFVIFLLINLLLSYMCMYFVYNKYFYKGIIVVAIMSISATSLIFSEFYQLAFMRFIHSKVLTYISFARLVIACIVSFVLSKYYGIEGYSAGIALSNIITLIMFICLSFLFSKEKFLSETV